MTAAVTVSAVRGDVAVCLAVGAIATLHLTWYWSVFRLAPRLPILVAENLRGEWKRLHWMPGWPLSLPLAPVYLLFAGIYGALDDLWLVAWHVKWVPLRFGRGWWFRWGELLADALVVSALGAIAVTSVRVVAAAGLSCRLSSWTTWAIAAIVWYALLYPYLEWRGWGGD